MQKNIIRKSYTTEILYETNPKTQKSEQKIVNLNGIQLKKLENSFE